jgi:hypothetical protein
MLAAMNGIQKTKLLRNSTDTRSRVAEGRAEGRPYATKKHSQEWLRQKEEGRPPKDALEINRFIKGEVSFQVRMPSGVARRAFA